MARPNLRENSDQELENFKRNVSIVDYATSQLGYQVVREKDTPRYRALSNGNETIITFRGKDGKNGFFNQHDSLNDRGTIIDFVKTRQNKTLGETRQLLRQFMGQPVIAHPQAYVPTTKGPEELSPEQKTAIVASFLQLEKTLRNPEYLHSRGISQQTLDSQAFKGRVFNNIHEDAAGKKHVNTAFPIYDASGLISIEQKNAHYSGLPKGINSNGVFISNNSQGGREAPLKNLVITESGIDALSYHQLHGKRGENTLYVATAGTVSPERTEIIQRIIDKRRPDSVLIAQDNDTQGKRNYINFLNDLEPPRRYTRLEGESVPVATARDLSFSAGAAGKYHSRLNVEITHPQVEIREKLLADLTEKIGRLNGKPSEPEAASLQLRPVKTTPEAILLQVEFKNAEIDKAQTLARELRTGRDQRQGLREGFIERREPKLKDFNDDLKAGLPKNLSEGLRTQAPERENRSLKVS
jgi:hypothetical protein